VPRIIPGRHGLSLKKKFGENDYGARGSRFAVDGIAVEDFFDSATTKFSVKTPATKPIDLELQAGTAPTDGNLERDHAGRTAPRRRQSGITPAELPSLRVLPPAAVRVFVARKQRRAASTKRERVLVMDGHPMVEEWIGSLIGGEADLVFAGHAADLAETTALVGRGHPSLVLLEIAKDIPRGLEIVRELKAKFPKLRMLVFSSCDEIAHSVQVLRAGAHGFVSKQASGAELLRAIRQVLDDGVYLSSAMIGHLATSVADSNPAPAAGPGAILSQRELQVFSFIGEGLHPKEISQRISLSVKTVESYLARIREKLGLRDARALFQDAVKWTKEQDRTNRR
jgi:DNA-binding NarL/FixJ family response regulator